MATQPKPDKLSLSSSAGKFQLPLAQCHRLLEPGGRHFKLQNKLELSDIYGREEIKTEACKGGESTGPRGRQVSSSQQSAGRPAKCAQRRADQTRSQTSTFESNTKNRLLFWKVQVLLLLSYFVVITLAAAITGKQLLSAN